MRWREEPPAEPSISSVLNLRDLQEYVSNCNAKTWERDRRNRMNTYFKTLSDLLPPHQEGRKRNKVDILIHASKYIKELNNRTDELFGAHAGEAHKEELNRLKKLVTQLFSRTQLLSALLRDAGITVPAEPALEKISPLKWSNKINVEESEKYVDRLSERKKPEKRRNKQIGYKVPSKQKNVGLVIDAAKKVADVNETVERSLIEDRENHVNSSINESCDTRDTGTGSSNENENTTSGRIVTAASQHDAVPPLEPTVAKPGKRIRKLESRKKVKRKGKVVDSKMKKKKIHATSAQSQSITNLLPGTLIWSAGKIVPLVTPVTSLTPNILVSAQAQPSNPIILGNAQQNQMIVMQSLTNRVQNSVLPVRNETLMKAVQKVSLNGVSGVQTSLGINSRDWSMKNIIEATKIAGRKVILPKGKEITTTTMTYKVPIPAIHREPSTKLNEAIDHQNSRKTKKIVKNKKVQRREKLEAEVPERADKNEAALGAVDAPDAVRSPEESSSILPESLEINEKKRKASEDPTLSYDQPAKIPKISDPSAESRESIESLRNVIERIGENTNEISEAVVKSKDDNNTSVEVTEPGNTSNESPATKENDRTSKPEVNHVLPGADATGKNSSRSEPENSEDSEAIAVEPKLASDWSPKVTSKTPKKENENDSAVKSVRSAKDTADIGNAEETAFSEVDEAIAKAGVVSDQEKDVCDLGTRFDSLLRATENTDSKIDDNGIVESTKIILNLDTNTTTTMKPEVCLSSVDTIKRTVSPPILSNAGDIVDETRIVDRTKEDSLKSLNYSSINTFVPIGNNRTDGLHSDLSNDLFASLQVPSSSHNPESISPTAAFLMAFPLVSSLNGKTEVLEEEMKEDLKYHSQTPPMLLQIGAMEPNSFKVKTDPPPAASTITIDKSNSQESEIVKITHRSTNEAAKSLPKIINNETIKEPLYKVVHYPEAASIASDNFATAPNSTRPSDRINTTVATVEIQSASNVESTSMPAASTCTTVTHVSPDACENSIRRCENQPENDALVAKYEETNSDRTIVSSNCTSDSSKYGSNGRYPTIPDYVPSYTNFANSSQQTRSNYGSIKSSPAVNASESSAVSSSLDSSTGMVLPSMIRSQAVQSAYVAHTTGKDVVHSMYGNRRKDSIVNQTEAMTSYAAFPSVSQTLQHDYLLRNKESYQSCDIHGKDNNASFQGYPAVTTKNSTINNTSANQQERSYVTSHITDNANVKDALNVFQNYPSIPQSAKESSEQDGNDERSRENQRVEVRAANRKIDHFPVGQSASYSSFPKEAKNDILGVDTMFQQAKRNEPQSYAPYGRDTKKTVYDANSSMPQTTKSPTVGNSTIPHYASHQLNPQQEQNCVATSNYPHSTTISDNTIKSTTTVAHNSSNFSILSWTTFSPISGSSVNNNVSNSNSANHAQYEATGGGHVERTETKTPCENYAYAAIQKESYGNILPTEGFSTDSPIVEKPRDKLHNDSLKPQIFEDSSKPKAVEPIASEQKMARSHNQNRNADYKFAAETKNKSSKYPMGSAYTQTEFTTLEQQQSAKSHQAVNEKSEKSNYPMPTYDPQASFDIPDTSVTNKCNNEIYNSSNYKYVEDKSTSLQLKYQSHTHNQSSILHHDAASYNGVKDVNQQIQQAQQQQQQTISNKSKTLVQQQQLQHEQQQQPLRPPVNWMMTPEIKHSSNIADLILPPIGKEHEFCQNNIFAQASSYNQSTPNHQFYNNYDAAVSAPHGFPNIPTLQADPRRIPDGFYPEEQPFSWSPTKSSQIEHNPGQKSMDQNVVPSTLPTLVGDLALGTNISEKQSFLFGQMASRVNKDIIQPPVNKDKEHYQTMLNAQNPQQAVQGTSFLSVSQLVEQEKAEKSHQQQSHPSHNHNHHHNHNNPTHQHHHHQQQQQQPSSHQTSQQQTRKHPRKNTNASPRTTAKRQIEARKTTAMSTVVDPLHSQPADEQKLSSSHNFPDQSYHHLHHHQQQHHHQHQQHHQTQQTQKFQQNDVHWRNRQCKSNYTAEALIGGNTSVHDNNNSDKQMQASTIKSFASEYPQNKYPTGIGTAEMIMPTINYLSNPSDDPNSYGQTVNQNFNPSSYAYSPNTNIYPTTNFITSISNTPTNYMMPLHENPSDFMETNSFLLPNVVTSSTKTTLNVSSTAISAATSSRLVTSSSLSVGTNSKNQQQHYTSSSVAKNQNCEKRNSYPTNGTKKSKRKTDNGSMHNLEFPISTVGPQIDDYHPHHHHHHAHPSTFLAPPHANPLYQNHSHPSSVGLTPNANRSVRTAALSNNATLGHHHPSGTSLTNFNLSTIFPEINDKVAGYKPPNVILPELSQTSNHSTVTYPQRGNYTANNILGHVHQESSQFTSDLPAAPPPGVLHYKNT